MTYFLCPPAKVKENGQPDLPVGSRFAWIFQGSEQWFKDSSGVWCTLFYALSAEEFEIAVNEKDPEKPLHYPNGEPVDDGYYWDTDPLKKWEEVV